MTNLFEVLAGIEHIVRIDHGHINKTPRNFSKTLNLYHHTNDWNTSGKVENKLPSLYKTKISKGLFGGTLKDTAPYVIPRHIDWSQHFHPKTGQSIITIDKKHENEVKNSRSILSTWHKQNKFVHLPTGERFSNNPGKPNSQKIIHDPIKHMMDNGHKVQFKNLQKHINNLKKLGIDYHFDGEHSKYVKDE